MLGWRMVTTGHDAAGRATFRSDRSLSVDDERAPVRAGRIMAVGVPALSVDDGDDQASTARSGPGTLAVDAIVVDPTERWLVDPSDVASGRFEALIVVRGEVHVTVGSDEVSLEPGAVFVGRGVPFGARTSAEIETRLLVIRAEPDPGTEPGLTTSLEIPSAPARRVRRVVAGTDEAGHHRIVHDGDPATMLVVGEDAAPLVVLADVWEFGGPVVGADQGGDAPEPFELEPAVAAPRSSTSRCSRHHRARRRRTRAGTQPRRSTSMSSSRGRCRCTSPICLRCSSKRGTSCSSAAPTTSGTLSAPSRSGCRPSWSRSGPGRRREHRGHRSARP